MGLWNFLSGGKKAQAQTTQDQPECKHLVLTPRWDSVEDIGHEEKATSFRCIGCNADFSVEAGHEIQRGHAAAR